MRAMYYKRDFWSVENRKYAAPGFRMQKGARIIRKLASDAPSQCDLLDVGCGPAALASLTGPAVRYHGIDIAIAEPAPGLVEMDFLEQPLGSAFAGQRFDVVVAFGVFEYLGEHQAAKLAEIADLLTDRGTFLVSYVNFGHRNRAVYWPYSNVRPLASFRDSLAEHFRVARDFPVGHNWSHTEPNRPWLKAPQLPLTISIPVLSRTLAVEYFFLCAKKPA